MPAAPVARAKHRKEYGPADLIEKIDCYVRDVDSGMEDSKDQWLYLKSIFLKLHKKQKLNSIEHDIMELVEPIIMKYAEYDQELAPQIEGHLLNKTREG
jgi:hypothetical protein